MKYGDNITTASQPLLPGMWGYNGTDFDVVRSTADNADAVAAVTGGQNGAPLRVLGEVWGFNGTQFDRIRSAADNADGLAVITLGALRVLGEHLAFNGTSYDRWRTNMDNVTLAALSASTTSSQSADQINYNARGLKVFINVTAFSGTSITFKIQGKDPVSGVYFDMLTGTAITATGTQLLTIYPGLTAVANTTATDVLPRTWRLSWAISSATVTATAGGIVLL